MDNEFLRVEVNPPVQLNKDDGWINISIRFSGYIGYHSVGQTLANRINTNVCPRSGNKNFVANYKDLFKSSMADSMGIVDIKRPDGDNLADKYGMIEKLEFEFDF